MILRLVLDVLLALISLRHYLGLHVVGSALVGRQLDDALKRCYLGIALLVVSLKHQHFA